MKKKIFFYGLLFYLIFQSFVACSTNQNTQGADDENAYEEYLYSTIQKRAKDFEHEQIVQECLDKGMILKKGQCVPSKS